ncbi:MAG: outer membrane beta-barrel protein [Chthoniobacterales bacterium]
MSLLCLLGPVEAQENPDAQGAVDTTQAGTETATEGGTTTEVTTPHLGTGNFSRSPFRISVSVREGYDDNIYTTKFDTVDSFYTNGDVVLDYKFGDARTQVAFEAFGGLTYYYDHPFGREYDINSGVSLSVRHQATPRLGLGATIYLAYQSEPDFNTGFGLNRRAGNYFYTSDKFFASYQWAPRFSTLTSYTLGALNYEDNSVGFFEDRVEHTFGNEFRFLVLPTTTAVAEYRFLITDYETAPRDSTTQFVLAGLDHSFNPRFNVSLRGGAQFREFDNFGDETSPYAEATLNYALTEKSSVSWNNRYGLDEPDIPGAASRTTFRTGLRANYAFTPRFSSTFSFYYQHDENDGLTTPDFFVPSFNEDSLDLSLGLRYEINSTFAVLAGYRHTEALSDVILREYARNRYYLGLSATF